MRVRCKGTNVCLVCRRYFVRETVEMLKLDAMEDAPSVYIVLTAREFLTRAACYEHLNQIRKALRRRWPEVEWFITCELQKRGALHLNLMVKHVPVALVDDVGELAVGVWCSRVDAEPQAQYHGLIEDAGGVVAYVHKTMEATLAHGLKRSQQPGTDWRGHRTSQTRGYFVRPVVEMRREARLSLSLRAELARGIAETDNAHDAELLAQERFAEARSTAWAFVSTHHLATEWGWAELAREMTSRDVEPVGTWADLDAMIAGRARADAETITRLREVFPDAEWVR